MDLVLYFFIVISFISIVIYFSFLFFHLLTRNINLNEQIKNNNIAVAIFYLGIIISNGIIFYNILNGISDYDINSMDKYIRLLFILVLGFFVSFLLIWWSIKIFPIVTINIDDMKAIKSNNYAVSILLSIVIISNTYLSEDLIYMFTKSLISNNFTGDFGLLQPFFNIENFFISFISIALILFISILLFLSGFRIMHFATKNVNEFIEFRKHNSAISTIISSSIVSVIIILKPVLTFFVTRIVGTLFSKDLLLLAMKNIAIYIFSIILFSIFAIFYVWAFFAIFIFISKYIDNEEIKRKNISSALIISIFLIITSIFIRFFITKFSETLLTIFLKFKL